MSPAWVVYWKEVRESLRDRRVLMNSLLLGPLLGPILFLVMMRLIVGRELEKAEQPLPVVVIGAERAPELIDALRQMGLEVKPAVADPEQAVREQRIDLALRVAADFGAAWRAGRPAEVEIIYDSSRREGGSDVDRLRGMLEGYSHRNGSLRLLARGLSPGVASPLVVSNRDTATPQARGALLFAMLPYMLVLTIFIGGLWLAIDSTAGERERQSLEPLLANPVPRDRILLGKLMATASFSTASLALGLLAFLVVGQFMPTEQLGMSLALGPHFLAVALPVLVPLVLLLCIGQILIAAFARSVREAQTYLGLAQLVPIIPSIILSVLPVKAKLWMYAVPLLGQQLSIMRLLRAEPVQPVALALSAAVTLLAALLVFLVTRRVYESERLAVAT
ncbi:MAG TPA: ABC transporter permease [Steroidobacteraceae bacterium]|nr:ABC transporter permease [Steroidobacteraceae bacterium]